MFNLNLIHGPRQLAGLLLTHVSKCASGIFICDVQFAYSRTCPYMGRCADPWHPQTQIHEKTLQCAPPPHHHRVLIDQTGVVVQEQ